MRATAVPNEPAPTTEARRGCPTRRAMAGGYPGGSPELCDLVVRAVAALGRSQAPALGGDRPALHAVGRRDLDVHRPAGQDLAAVAVLLQLLEHLVGQLVDLRRAHVAPHQSQLERHLLLDADVVRRVVA